MSNEKLYTNGNLCSIITFATIVRWSVSLHPYSGQNTPPMFGDYEAQRHWMEITVNLPVKEWYCNTSRNDLMYWGLDYPPLTAYHSYINGKLAEYIDPDFIKLNSSRGYESSHHKFFMRTTVIVADLAVYFVSVILFYNFIYARCQSHVESKHSEIADIKENTNFKVFNTSVSYLAQIAISLLYPGLILIDHGHFQYNSISLGFTISAVTALGYEKFFLSSFFFCLAINYKQMSLYHSLPFFVYILRSCFKLKKYRTFINCFIKLFCISLYLIFIFAFIWYPFLTNIDIFLQVVRRLFPLSRGIFEDKVSNIWCVVNIFYKLNKNLTNIQMTKICTCFVLLTGSASLFDLFKRPSIMRLILSLINVSLCFFLFSYQVHEKSILLTAIPVLLYFPFDPFPSFWFLIISNFSMLPLLLKDKLFIPFLSLSALFTLFVFANVNFHINLEKKPNKNQKKLSFKRNVVFYVSHLFWLSIFFCLILTLMTVFVKPPVRYPDIWPLLVSAYSCLHFFLFCLYFNYVQIFKIVD